MFEALEEAAREHCPAHIDDIWLEYNKNTRGSNTFSSTSRNSLSLEHVYVQIIDKCYDRPTFSSLLGSEARCRALTENVTRIGMAIGMFSKELQSGEGKHTIVSQACLGCNLCSDSGGCHHGHSYTLVALPCDQQQTAECLHSTNKLLVVLGKLLTLDLTLQANQNQNDDSDDLDVDLLCSLLAPCLPPGEDPLEHVIRTVRESGYEKSPPTNSLVGLVDNCASNFPKLAHYAVAVLSLIVARKPAGLLALLDESVFCKVLDNFLARCVFRLVNNAECFVEESIGLVNLLNSLPILYYLEHIKEAHDILVRSYYPGMIANLVCNLMCCAAHYELSDAPLDLQKFPELYHTHIFVAPLFDLTPASRELFRSRPMTFAIACLLEILGRWQRCGIPVYEGAVPVCHGEPATVSSALQECYPKLLQLETRVGPILTPTVKIANAIIAKKSKCPFPRDSESMLRLPLRRAAERCELATCRARTTADGQPLLVCAGGCNGIAVYCCQEHQKKDWKQHRAFCKRVSR